MSSSITLSLPDDVYRRAESLAQLMNRDLGEVLVEAISLSLSPISPAIIAEESAESTPVSSLSDLELLALTEGQMESDQDLRLSELLERQQAGSLSEAERPELWALMQIYQVKLLRQAQALREAVSRGLREPLEEGDINVSLTVQTSEKGTSFSSSSPSTNEEDVQTAWNSWLAEVDQLDPSPPQLELDEYGKALIEKYKKQGLAL